MVLICFVFPSWITNDFLIILNLGKKIPLVDIELTLWRYYILYPSADFIIVRTILFTSKSVNFGLNPLLKYFPCRNLWRAALGKVHSIYAKGLVPKRDGLGKRNFTVLVTQLKTEFTCSKSLSGKTSFYKIDMMVGERKNSLSQGLGRNFFLECCLHNAACPSVLTSACSYTLRRHSH